MSLTPEQTAALTALANRPTYYEVEVVRPDARSALVGYTARRSGAGIRKLIRDHADAIVAFLQPGPSPTMAPAPKCPAITFKVDGGGLIRFSGRTKRDVILRGNPLPCVTDEASAASPTKPDQAGQ